LKNTVAYGSEVSVTSVHTHARLTIEKHFKRFGSDLNTQFMDMYCIILFF